MRVMIFTAPVGAGHNAAAAALGHDLTAHKPEELAESSHMD
jgi:hypothetical protein